MPTAFGFMAQFIRKNCDFTFVVIESYLVGCLIQANAESEIFLTLFQYGKYPRPAATHFTLARDSGKHT